MRFMAESTSLPDESSTVKSGFWDLAERTHNTIPFPLGLMTLVMAGPFVLSTKSESLPSVQQATNYTLRRDLIICFRAV